MSYVPRLKTKYVEEVAPALMEQFQYKTVMQVPKIVKICVNQGVGGATQDKKLVENSINEMSTITGQKAVPTKARLSISNFKLREGMPIGVRVTLRGVQMYEFLDRLVTVALPREFDLDVPTPTGVVPTPEAARMRPEIMAYPQREMKFKHYGNNVLRLINRAREMEGGVIKE